MVLTRASLFASLALASTVACGSSTSPPAPPDLAPGASSETERTEPPRGEEPTSGESVAPPPAPAPAPPAEPATPLCATDAPCTDDQRCKTNDGALSRNCSCSAGRFACIERAPDPPTTCVPGAACTGDAVCAVDNGTSARRCRCREGTYACSDDIAPSTSCTQNPLLCFSSQPSPDAVEWLHCYARQPSMTVGVVCSVGDGSTSTSGVVFTPVCPSSPPREADGCGFTASSPTCACVSVKGAPCVCGCDSTFAGGIWKCL